MRPRSVHRPRLSIFERDPVDVVEEGLWWIELVSGGEDTGDSELLVVHANINFFDPGTKLY